MAHKNSQSANQPISQSANQPISQSAQPQKQQNQAQKTHNLFVRFCLNLTDFSMRLF